MNYDFLKKKLYSLKFMRRFDRALYLEKESFSSHLSRRVAKLKNAPTSYITSSLLRVSTD